MVELIPKQPDQIIPKLPDNAIEPDTYEAYVEMVVLGLRNLAPYKFVKMQNPYLEIEVSKTPTTTTTVSTAPPQNDPTPPIQISSVPTIQAFIFIYICM